MSSPFKGSQWIIATGSGGGCESCKHQSRFPVGTKRLACATEGGRRFQQGVSYYTLQSSCHKVTRHMDQKMRGPHPTEG